MSKFMEIKKVPKEYIITTKKERERIGKISYHVTWRKLVFEPDADTMYDAECLKDIIDWLQEIKNKKL